MTSFILLLQLKMKDSIGTYFPAGILLSVKFLSLSYFSKYPHPLKQQNFSNSRISKKIRVIVQIFYMQLDMYGSYKLVMPFELGVVRHAQVCPKWRYNTNQNFCNVLSECVNFWGPVGHPWKLKIDLVILDGCGQACQGMLKVLRNNQ